MARQFLCKIIGHDYDISIVEEVGGSLRVVADQCTRCGRTTRSLRPEAIIQAIRPANDAYGRIHTDGSRSGGQPTVATQKAHTMVREVLAEWGIEPRSTTPAQLTIATTEALCRAIDQIEDLRVEAQAQYDRGYYEGCTHPLQAENERLREHLISALDTLKDAGVCDDNCDPCNEARAELEQSE